MYSVREASDIYLAATNKSLLECSVHDNLFRAKLTILAETL